eukprot:5190969-Heterocapsa_arctica.AAC.1
MSAAPFRSKTRQRSVLGTSPTMAAPAKWQAKDHPGDPHGREELNADLHTSPPGGTRRPSR